jgi:hypothetical protein
MQELDELRPAPRRTPTAILWLMGIVFVGGGGLLLLLESPTQSPAPAASGTAHRPAMLAEARPRPTPPAGRPASSAAPNLSDLHVP